MEKKRGLLVVVSGPAGAGKDCVVKELEKRRKFTRIVTYNTREKRVGEAEGIDYHFISREEFLEKKSKGFFLETNEYRGNFYGTPNEEILRTLARGEDILLRIDVNGAKSVEREFPGALTIFLYAEKEELRRRLLERGREDEGEIEKKMAVAEEEIKEMNKDYFDYAVENKRGRLKEAIEEVMEIIEQEKQGRKTMRMGDLQHKGHKKGI